MKKIVNSRIIVLLYIGLIVPCSIIGQADKAAAEKKKQEAGLMNAQANVAKNEKQLQIADSLISSGTEAIAESKSELKAIEADRKKQDKEYATEKKLLTKMTLSQDKAEAAKAKADLKALEAKRKTNVKDLDNRTKEANKKSTTGNSNLTKGKTMKKTAQTGLKTAQEALSAAQAKQEAPAEDEQGNSKKKK